MLAGKKWLYSYNISKDLCFWHSIGDEYLASVLNQSSVLCAINYRIATAARWLVVGLATTQMTIGSMSRCLEYSSLEVIRQSIFHFHPFWSDRRANIHDIMSHSGPQRF